MNIQTGKTPTTAMTLAAILSLSLVVNLPGLAVTPMLSSLSKIFPDTTETEKQLLTVMPNLLIILFVLLSGKLSLTRHKIATIVCGIVLFTGASIAYMFATSMTALIIISCFLGCGAGLIIPFAAGLIADCFVGRQRMKMMGLKSGISNLSLVVATFAVGWLSNGNWHLPFAVYLVALIPLVFAFKLNSIPQADLANPTEPGNETTEAKADSAPVSANTQRVVGGFYLGKIIQVTAIYATITFLTMLISYYSPFLIKAHNMPDSLTGTVTAFYFLFIFLPGFILGKVVKMLKSYTFILAGVSILVGLLIFAFMHQPVCMCIGSALTGLGYGICQPLIYDKASRTVVSPAKSTMALAIVLAANYIAIAAVPFIVDVFGDIFNASHSVDFPFVLATMLSAVYLLITITCKNAFGFTINKTYY